MSHGGSFATNVGRPATCRSCGAAIVWCKTANGKTMPVDAEPADSGNVRVADGIATVLGALEVHAARAAGEALRLSHFASCPQAAEHRRTR